MSKIAECPNGGMQGILVSNEELAEFAKKLKKQYIDAVIPLPNMSLTEQKEAIKECGEHSGKDARYWESSTTGSHGWCCPKCGTVTQWG